MLTTIALVIVSAAVTIAAAALLPPVAHIPVAAACALALAAVAISENRRLLAAGAKKTTLSAATARHMASVWGWGFLSLLVTYVFFVHWYEWWQFVLAFAALTILCSLFAVMTTRDERAGREDWTMLILARRLTIAQLVGMVIAMVGLLVDGKMTRYLNIRKGWEDWAANNIFFFGALALALISANALWTSRDMKPASGAPVPRPSKPTP